MSAPRAALPLTLRLFLLSTLTLLPAPAFSQEGFGLRLLPGAAIPLGTNNFESGFGAAASVDWVFLPRLGPLGPQIGLSLGGGFSGLGVKDGSRVSLYEGGLGPLVQWTFRDRFVLRAEAAGGLYHARWEGREGSGLKLGGALSGAFRLSPAIFLTAQGGYTWYHTAGGPPFSALSLTAGVGFNLSELFAGRSKVRAEKTRHYPVFPVSWAWYAHNPVAAVRIRNDEPAAITAVQVSFYMEQYMNEPTPAALIPRLEKGRSAEVPVTALFNEAMLDLTENTAASARLIVTYQSLGAAKEASFPLEIPVYHRNAMSWDDDRRAASFVSSRDPAAVLFARTVESALRGRLSPGIPRNIQYAAALFEALNLYGLTYIVDPASSYALMSEDASALDTLNYPYQTLLYRGGDCDDMAILYCSLLEVLKIDTAFITIPGHIYMAFDSGIDAHTAAPDGGAEGLIPSGGRLWLPVEITIPDEGFRRAWRTGLAQWRAAGEKAALHPTHDSWETYPPVSVPGAGRRVITVPEDGAIIRAFEQIIENREQ
jgi:hypothetical protein